MSDISSVAYKYNNSVHIKWFDNDKNRVYKLDKIAEPYINFDLPPSENLATFPNLFKESNILIFSEFSGGKNGFHSCLSGIS